MKGRQIIIFCSVIVFPLAAYVSAQNLVFVENNPPKVQIIIPKNADTFTPGSYVRYSISVTDKEDGSSEFEEIAPKEVFLEINYLPGDDKVKQDNIAKGAMKDDPAGLALMKTSTCFNCHMVKSKLTGPSFLEIIRKYPNNSATLSILANKVIKGSSGVWTNTNMPPNPAFTVEQAKQMIQWIFKSAGDPNRNYLVGTEGNFKTISNSANGKGSYVLVASYTDHGLKDVPKSNQRGYATVIIRSK
jgi:cytochrome c